MPGLVRVSDAASLALHAAVLLAGAGGSFVSVARMAEELGVSSAHMAKVMQWLSRAGIVRAVRGPHGGFILARDPGSVYLRDVFEAIEGPLTPTGCLLERPACDGTACIFGDAIARAEAELAHYLTTTNLAHLAGMHFGPRSSPLA